MWPYEHLTMRACDHASTRYNMIQEIIIRWHYCLNDAIVSSYNFTVPYIRPTQFSRNVCLISSANRDISAHHDFLILAFVTEDFFVANIYDSFI